MDMNAESKCPIHFHDHYVVDDGPITTVTKADRVAAAALRELGASITLVAPVPATVEELLRIHDAAYVDALLTGEPLDLAVGGLGAWSLEILRSVLASNGGVRDAALRALEIGVAGSLSSGLHHARRTHGEGFCTVNGLALAAFAALDAGAGEVGILDVDAHCGSGTFEICGDDERIRLADVAVNGYDSWSPRAARHSLVIDRDPGAYLAHVAEALDSLEGVGLVLHNAGMDPIEGGGAGATTGFTSALLAEREQLIAQWARRTGTPIAFVLAGGYLGPDVSIDDVVELHLHTLRAFAPLAAERAPIERTASDDALGLLSFGGGAAA